MSAQDVLPDSPARWHRRARGAGLVRAAVFAAPVLASFAAALAVRSFLPMPEGPTHQVVSLVLLGVVSTVVLLLVDRLGRRVLPLATLLDLSMLFPDRAPSRLRVARDAIRRRPIEDQLRRVAAAGADPQQVAREILTLIAALSSHDRPTRGHAERVRMFTDLIAEQMGLPERDRDLMRWAAILHDIGKLRIPASLLNKPGRLTPEEWTVLRAHPLHGAQMAAGLLPWLDTWGDCIAEHHERYDGTGYPLGLSGEGISLGARIVAVADAYDVMTATRAYRRPVSRAAALDELVRWSGRQFDPAVVRAMVAVRAPSHRRAQGVVAWLANIPLVATTAVPAATMARVVGAGAMATGAVTGSGAVAEVVVPPPAERTVQSASTSSRSATPPATVARAARGGTRDGITAKGQDKGGKGKDPEQQRARYAAQKEPRSGPAKTDQGAGPVPGQGRTRPADAGQPDRTGTGEADTVRTGTGDVETVGTGTADGGGATGSTDGTELTDGTGSTGSTGSTTTTTRTKATKPTKTKPARTRLATAKR